ncbi:PTS fructose transporter subunit IIABC [Mesomycoplasma molare]|uniref:Fructose-specific PTS transporter subunit EIIC n=1 Tax=Mesomycoplasma molare TaxID=171288 RepID=A0ABY5TTB7_9BACT|nr:fructose-specific PTS transporter subunit EIIC [Mesomycoplasma molare]UWD33922.1 fructose-specific PTS transporter subunit EIIC [Mesomycoplasma molare]
MKIKSLFKNKDTIFLNTNLESKDDVLKFFAKELFLKKYGADEEKIYKLFKERENQSSTGFGNNIAMPHFGDETMNESTLLFARVNDIDWNSIDNQPVKYIFGIAFSKNDRENSHIEVISKLAKFIDKEEFKKELSTVNSSEEFLSLIQKFEEETQEQISVSSNNNKEYDIVAVTACPTGIAHTYLAEQKLIEQAKAMNLTIKVETQGAEGIKNSLSIEEIKNAKGVIIAIDREIEKGKFAHNDNIVEISTQKAIHKPEEQIKKILENKGQKIKVAKKLGDQNSDQDELSFAGFGKKMHRSLLNGISYMLPFIVFGGIILALGFIIDLITGSLSGKDINSAEFLSNFGFNNSIAKLFFEIGKIGLGLAVPVLAAYISFAIVGRQGLLPGFVVGSIASGGVKGTYGFLLDSITNSGVQKPGDFLGTGSGFVGAILGAFYVGAMVIVFSKYVFGNLPKTFNGIKNILFIPLLGTIAIALSFWLVNIVLIYINLGLVLLLQLMQNKPYLAWLLGVVLGSMMAVDLGGPINKAAYIFGTLTIVNGNSSVSMAAVMIAGMVPPLGISLSMIMHKKLWTKEEIEAGKISNIIFGLSFISEGAIPYTSKNPKVLIPSNIVGGAVAGMISALLGVNIVAPHGGIFVVFLAKSNLFVNNAVSIGMGILFWFIALFIGALASALMIWILNKYPINFKTKKRKNV